MAYFTIFDAILLVNGKRVVPEKSHFSGKFSGDNSKKTTTYAMSSLFNIANNASFDSHEKLIERITALTRDGSSFKAAFSLVAKEQHLSTKAVQSCYYRHKPHSKTMHGNCKLTEVQDKLLLSLVMSLSACHFAVTCSQLVAIVKNVFAVKVGHSWVYAWLKQHKNLPTMQCSKFIETKRLSMSTVDSVMDFCDALELSMDAYRYAPNNVYSYDETCI